MYVVLPAWKKNFPFNSWLLPYECIHHPRSNETDLSSFFIARTLRFLMAPFIWRRVSKWLVCHFPRKKIESPKRWMTVPHFCHRQPSPNIRRQSARFSHFLLTRGDRIFGDLPNQASPKHSRKGIIEQLERGKIDATVFFFCKRNFVLLSPFLFRLVACCFSLALTLSRTTKWRSIHVVSAANFPWNRCGHGLRWHD